MNDILLPIVQTINAYLSDYILVVLLLGCGLYFSIRTKFVQVRCFGEGMKNVFGKLSLKGGKQGGGMSSFQALATAIAAQVGTGNIVGASGAILVGGPGAIFWMWIIAFLGMATIYAEAVLAQKTRVVKENGQFGNVFIEMSACEGSCVNGPCIREHTERRLKGALRVDTFAGDQRFDVAAPDTISYNYPFLGGKKVKFGSEAINDMLYKMGKTSPEKELNCGSCGYPTCRDKAIAILEGKAKIEMCLPFLKEKAESFSDSIINNTPNAIIVMDEDLVVQQINRAAVRMFKLKDANDILHEHIVRILNPGDYQNIITSALHTTTRMHYLADYELYVDETILYDRQYHIVISLMRDVTEQETLRGQDAELRRQTVEITDKVIEKQMRVVQEIASLLGETTAETKIALTKLKDAMAHE